MTSYRPPYTMTDEIVNSVAQRCVFAELPVETLVKQHQNEYYTVIDQCNAQGEATAFVAFMLRLIQLAVVRMQDMNNFCVQNCENICLLCKNASLVTREADREPCMTAVCGFTHHPILYHTISLVSRGNFQM